MKKPDLMYALFPVCWGLQAFGIIVSAYVPVVVGMAVSLALGVLSIWVDVPGFAIAAPPWLAVAIACFKERYWPVRREIT